MGEWIEIAYHRLLHAYLRSHPSWVSGLKLFCLKHQQLAVKSHPSWVSGLKLERGGEIDEEVESHPSWVSGLKSCL